MVKDKSTVHICNQCMHCVHAFVCECGFASVNVSMSVNVFVHTCKHECACVSVCLCTGLHKTACVSNHCVHIRVCVYHGMIRHLSTYSSTLLLSSNSSEETK